MIKLSAFAKDAIILDPFVGSGIIAVAAKKLGKNYTGIDVNEKYVKISERRLKELDEKPDLFIDTATLQKHTQRTLQVQLQIA